MLIKKIKGFNLALLVFFLFFFSNKGFFPFFSESEAEEASIRQITYFFMIVIKLEEVGFTIQFFLKKSKFKTSQNF